MRDRTPDFAERALGYRSFMEFCRAAQARGLVTIEKRDSQYLLRTAELTPPVMSAPRVALTRMVDVGPCGPGISGCPGLRPVHLWGTTAGHSR